MDLNDEHLASVNQPVSTDVLAMEMPSESEEELVNNDFPKSDVAGAKDVMAQSKVIEWTCSDNEKCGKLECIEDKGSALVFWLVRPP